MRIQFKKLIIAAGYTFFKIIRIPIKWYWKKFNIRTHGVRVMLVYQNQIILVRHWYNSLWVMPGGGIKKNETPEQAAVREVREELRLEIKQLDYKLGTYSNTKDGKNDTVHCFVAELEEQPILKKRFNFEISDIVCVDIDNVPEGTSQATCTRIKEYLNKDISLDIRTWS